MSLAKNSIETCPKLRSSSTSASSSHVGEFFSRRRLRLALQQLSAEVSAVSLLKRLQFLLCGAEDEVLHKRLLKSPRKDSIRAKQRYRERRQSFKVAKAIDYHVLYQSRDNP